MVDVAQTVPAVFVVAAERDIAVGGNHHCAAQAEAVGVEPPFRGNVAVGGQAVAAVFRIQRQKAGGVCRCFNLRPIGGPAA